jgi:hypothetical protein
MTDRGVSCIPEIYSWDYIYIYDPCPNNATNTASLYLFHRTQTAARSTIIPYIAYLPTNPTTYTVQIWFTCSDWEQCRERSYSRSDAGRVAPKFGVVHLSEFKMINIHLLNLLNYCLQCIINHFVEFVPY